MLLRVVLVALAFLVAPAGAHAAMDDGVTVHREACPFYADGGSCATPDTGEAWVEPGAGRFAYWHEVAHVWERRALADEHRAWFADLFGFPAGTAWDQGTGPGTRGPSEVFADAFAACATRARVRGVRRGGMVVSAWSTAYGYLPTARQHQRVCNAIAVADLIQ
jgi:hypothetical protein